MKGILFFDGSSRGNPGNAGIGVVIVREDKKVKKLSKSIGTATNNQAEYIALIEGLKLAKKLGINKLKVKGDSELIIKQVKGEYKVSDKKLKKLYEKVKEIEKDFEKIVYEWIPREKNLADKLAKNASGLS